MIEQVGSFVETLSIVSGNPDPEFHAHQILISNFFCHCYWTALLCHLISNSNIYHPIVSYHSWTFFKKVSYSPSSKRWVRDHFLLGWNSSRNSLSNIPAPGLSNKLSMDMFLIEYKSEKFLLNKANVKVIHVLRSPWLKELFGQFGRLKRCDCKKSS